MGQIAGPSPRTAPGQLTPQQTEKVVEGILRGPPQLAMALFVVVALFGVIPLALFGVGGVPGTLLAALTIIAIVVVAAVGMRTSSGAGGRLKAIQKRDSHATGLTEGG